MCFLLNVANCPSRECSWEEYKGSPFYPTLLNTYVKESMILSPIGYSIDNRELVKFPLSSYLAFPELNNCYMELVTKGGGEKDGFIVQVRLDYAFNAYWTLDVVRFHPNFQGSDDEFATLTKNFKIFSPSDGSRFIPICLLPFEGEGSGATMFDDDED
ncbi:uncharacterized protein LOC130988251 [Salvia miltiorrhiza]|uniref:uncharacterized protein LOC130988251 n=1 Tax=Salvia miltiorrhiza TaxID=226208 RepID=UPI0025ACFD85|nr:uncharacterized protein LOC130988251 [Salvia miltiorrhiza]